MKVFLIDREGAESLGNNFEWMNRIYDESVYL